MLHTITFDIKIENKMNFTFILILSNYTQLKILINKLK